MPCGSSVHPHARGEHLAASPNDCLGGGSSPRPWGTLLQAAPRASACTVHPHARGEHRCESARCPVGLGSSPRPWGTLDVVVGAFGPARFIPTPVGNTGRQSPGQPSQTVHPHARGEHRCQLITLIRSVGSSPRPWGTPRHQREVVALARFIPTPVGNTAPTQNKSHSTTVHPHARGEHPREMGQAEVEAGSSPRPWGTLCTGACLASICRFIPTPVGNTSMAEKSLARRSVHPHARGEHWVLSPPRK